MSVRWFETRNERTRGRSGTARAVLAALLAVTLFVGVAGKSYRYEDDPVRLGDKALTESRLDEARKHYQEAIDNEHRIVEARFGLGQIYVKEGALEEAEKILRLAEAEQQKEAGFGNREFPELHAALGIVLIRLGNTTEARELIEKALDEDAGCWPALYGLARLAIIDKNYQEARRLLDRGKNKKGVLEWEDRYLFGLALVQRAEGQIEEAEKNALKAWVMDPAHAEYQTLVAEIYESRGAASLAIDAYEKALATPGVQPTPRLYHSLGVLYQKQKRYNDALSRYTQAVQLDSTYTEAWRDLASLFALAKRYEDAAGAWLKYTSLEPDDLEGQLGLAEACLKTKRNKLALEAAQNAWGKDSTRVDVRLAMARAAFLNGDQERADWLYFTVRDTSKFDAEDMVRIGQLKLKQKDFAGADASLRSATRRDSTMADAYFWLGLVKLTERKPDSAEVHLRKAIELSPNSSGARLNLGIALIQQKRNSDAIPVLREAVRMAPAHPTGHLYLAHALFAADSVQAAKKEYAQVLELAPGDASATRQIGFILMREGDRTGARSYLRKATEADPRNVDGWTLLGQAALADGDFAEAITCFTRALEIRPEHALAKDGLEQARRGLNGGSAGVKEGG